MIIFERFRELPVDLPPKTNSIEELKSKLEEGNGNLIPLGKDSEEGGNICLAIRDELCKHPNLSSQMRVLLAEAFLHRGGILYPVGHYDWFISGLHASGSGNLHGQASNTTNLHWLAGEFIYEGIAFNVSAKHQRKGLGTLLIASSITALNLRQIQTLYPGGLLIPAQRAWSSFGVHNLDDQLVAELSRHPRVDQAFRNFID